jgi:hypothetical protein
VQCIRWPRQSANKFCIVSPFHQAPTNASRMWLPMLPYKIKRDMCKKRNDTLIANRNFQYAKVEIEQAKENGISKATDFRGVVVRRKKSLVPKWC